MAETNHGRPKIAAIVTVYRKYSHAQHIVDRLLDGTAGTARTIIPLWIWCRCMSIRSGRTI